MGITVSAEEICATLTVNSDDIEGTETTETASWKGPTVEETIKLDIGSSSDQLIIGGFPDDVDTLERKSRRLDREKLPNCLKFHRQLSEIV